ncbi:hypothetical protein EN868_11695 [Mesorhizobium sp. M2D.F.Ca.ET.225.01.1.1]|uniref:hypothetical protein n=1 Tax=unclassified Mesorhizobium TaxID=325217 RepID=UPI000FD5B998|nr:MULTISPECIES: hypothetical protein [unclassified Mesorhizobium]TGP55779.1 hypothetical protein EN869_025505 [Mesorhizobium sp. M2D.F.Ca.ET.226.01.1.1]TGP68237.1 hypothetical protein EN868_11695 [Mesorhizobium sp. M2D.F.Ca.ET.225.01.1.1]
MSLRLLFYAAMMVTASSPALADKVCTVAAGLMAGECHAGDNVKMFAIRQSDLPDTILRFCDTTVQVMTMPDTVSAQIGSDKNFVVLCKFHKEQ